MKPSYCLITAASLCMSITTSAQLPRIVVQGNGTPQVFTDLTAAITAAQADDYIYLSGGTFSLPSGTLLNKTLHLVGAGIHPDSTGVTGRTEIQSNATYRISTAASGSSFTGIAFIGAQEWSYGIVGDGSDDDPTGIVFQRCSFAASLNLSATPNSASSSTTFDECIFGTGSAQPVGNGGTAVLTRCIFSGSAGPLNFGNTGSGSLTMQHCVCIGTSGISGVTGGLFADCVFYGGFYSVTSEFSNCLFTGGGLPAGSVGSGNVFNLSPTTIFVDQTDNYFQFTDDLHLAAGSPGHNAGTDATDIGLYGSASPYKPGAAPVNPHYRLANIANATDGSGNLPVSIKVAAQGN
jgi:hypothetical protein